ncbi:MAG: YfhO family protein, partial [Marinilabiliaceae bacterium]|nr:YfhO family protein [Marinilabiliaceae bacterium]
TGEKAMWTNSMFGGMPAYQIRSDASKNAFSYFNRIARLGLPYETVAILFLYMLGFYLLLLSLKMNHWLSVIGAIAFAFGSYNLIIIITGHITKAYAIALMAPVIAGILYAFNTKKWIGALMTAVALGMEIAYNHVQITYYLFLTVIILVVVKSIYAIREKTLKPFLQTCGVLFIGALLAVLPNITNLWTTYEYGKASNRGASELTPPEGQKKSSGLDKDYAFDWSYGIHETLTLLVPNVVGGRSEQLAGAKEIMKKVDPRLKEYVGQSTQYWGGRTFTEGPVYLGAIVCFLFFLGAFFYQGKERWWLIAATILSLFLAWGKHFPLFNDFMFYHFPLYNKFRTVEMALVIASITIPLLGLFGLRTIIDEPGLLKQKSKWFFAAFGLTGGLCLLLYLAPSLFYNFLTPRELDVFGTQQVQGGEMGMMYSLLEENLVMARKSLLQSDALRSFFFILMGSGLIWWYSIKKFQSRYLLGALALLILIDLWAIDKRYLNNDNFISSRKSKQEFKPGKADLIIKEDPDLYYRVFPIFTNPFFDASTAYHHKSIGGFHGAKLRRYQDLGERYILKSYGELVSMLQAGTSSDSINDALSKMQILHMLNTKYIIYNQNAAPIVNPYYMSNAWFVNNVKLVENADEEIAAIGGVNLQNTAVVDKRFADYVSDYRCDSVSGILNLVTYHPDQLIFEVETDQDQLAVFSDIYYDKGWNAYIDGEKVEHIRVNYILRGLMIPAGATTVEFRFEPKSYQYGQWLAMMSSGLIVLLIIGMAVWQWR